jgi:hypothetical protein
MLRRLVEEPSLAYQLAEQIHVVLRTRETTEGISK